MPRIYPPKREHVGFRLSPARLYDVDIEAEREGVDRSTMLRRLISEALDARAATSAADSPSA